MVKIEQTSWIADLQYKIVSLLFLGVLVDIGRVFSFV